MNLSCKKTKYIVITLFAIAVFAVLGLYFIKNNTLPVTGNQSSQGISKEKISLEDTKAYLAIMPDVGPLLKQIEVKAHIDTEANTVSIPMQAKNLGEFKRNQKVMFRNTKGGIQLEMGKIADILIENSYAELIIEVPEQINISDLSKKMEIFVIEQRLTKRLPLTALQHDEQGTPFVWRAIINKEQENTTQIEPQGRSDTVKIDMHDEIQGEVSEVEMNKYFVTPGKNNGVFFDVGYRVPINTVILIDPDENIKNQERRNIFLTTIDAPDILPNYQAAIESYEKAIKQLAKEMRIAMADCKKRIEQSRNEGAIIGVSKEDPASCTIVPGSVNTGCDPNRVVEVTPLMLLGIEVSNSTGGACGN